MEVYSHLTLDLIAFFLMFLLLYFIAYFIVFKNWSSKARPAASSCFISLFHGTPAVFLAAYAILTDPNRSFSSKNTALHNTVLGFSVAYFVTDLLHYVVFFPGDVLFIGHHLATLFVFITCRDVVSYGAYAILVLLILAEVTSACQNLWTLSSARKGELDIAAKVYEFLSPPFYALYTVVRGFLGPIFVYQMGVFYMSGVADSVIPRWIWISWMVVVTTAIFLSILWIFNLWVGLYREKTRQMEKKIR